MTRGNQRDLARAKNAKKQQDSQKKKGATDKDKGMSLEQRKARDAEVMRLKQAAKSAGPEASSSSQ